MALTSFAARSVVPRAACAAGILLLTACTSFPGGQANPGLEKLVGKPLYLVAQRVSLTESDDAFFAKTYRATNCQHTGRVLTSGNQQLGYVSEREVACGWVGFTVDGNNIITDYQEGGYYGLRPNLTSSLREIADAPTKEAAMRFDISEYFGALGYKYETGELATSRNHPNAESATRSMTAKGFTVLKTYSNSCVAVAAPDRGTKASAVLSDLVLGQDADPPSAVQKAVDACDQKFPGKQCRQVFKPTDCSGPRYDAEPVTPAQTGTPAGTAAAGVAGAGTSAAPGKAAPPAK